MPAQARGIRSPSGGYSNRLGLRARLSFDVDGFRRPTSSVNDHHNGPKDQHRKSQFLTPAERPEVETDLRVRFSHELHEKSEESIKRDERPKHGPSIEILSIKPSQDQEQHQTFENCLVELRGMPRRAATFRKNHCPRYRRRAAEQFAVDEVSDASETKTD